MKITQIAKAILILWRPYHSSLPYSWCIQKSAADINLSIQLCLVTELPQNILLDIIKQAPGAARISWELTELAATIMICNVLILVEEDSFSSWSMTWASSVPSKKRLETWALTWIVHHHKSCRWYCIFLIQVGNEYMVREYTFYGYHLVQLYIISTYLHT